MEIDNINNSEKYTSQNSYMFPKPQEAFITYRFTHNGKSDYFLYSRKGVDTQEKYYPS